MKKDFFNIFLKNNYSKTSLKTIKFLLLSLQTNLKPWTQNLVTITLTI
jgi:hypothetical protein